MGLPWSRKVPLTIDLTASRRLAAKLESRHPDLSLADKLDIVVGLRKNHPGLAEGLAFVWKLG